jgi:hypothetical protein
MRHRHTSLHRSCVRKYFTSVVVLQDEANMKTAEQQNRRSQIKRLRKAVLLEGD